MVALRSHRSQKVERGFVIMVRNFAISNKFRVSKQKVSEISVIEIF